MKHILIFSGITQDNIQDMIYIPFWIVPSSHIYPIYPYFTKIRIILYILLCSQISSQDIVENLHKMSMVQYICLLFDIHTFNIYPNVGHLCYHFHYCKNNTNNINVLSYSCDSLFTATLYVIITFCKTSNILT